MVDKILLLRSDTAGHRPPAGSQLEGAPYVNMADRQFGVFDSTQTPQDFIGVPYFSQTAAYTAGEPVNFLGNMYVANTAIASGSAFNPAQWTPVNPLNAWSYGGPLRLFHNSALDICQRSNFVNGQPFVTIPPGVFQYTVDRWIVYATGAGIQIIQGSLAPIGAAGAVHALQINGVAGNTGYAVIQRLEAAQACRVQSQTVTFSFNVIQNVGAIVPTLSLYTPNALNDFSAVTQLLAPTNFQAYISGNQRYGLTVAGSVFTAAVQNGLEVRFNFPGNTNPSNGLNFLVPDMRVTPGVPAGLNYNPPPLERHDPATDWALCNRFYQSGYPYTFWSGYCVAGTANYVTVLFPVPMAKTPTITLVDQGVAGFPAGVPSIANSTSQGFQAQKTAIGTGAGYFAFFWTASADL